MLTILAHREPVGHRSNLSATLSRWTVNSTYTCVLWLHGLATTVLLFWFTTLWRSEFRILILPLVVSTHGLPYVPFAQFSVGYLKCIVVYDCICVYMNACTRTHVYMYMWRSKRGPHMLHTCFLQHLS